MHKSVDRLLAACRKPFKAVNGLSMDLCMMLPDYHLSMAALYPRLSAAVIRRIVNSMLSFNDNAMASAHGIARFAVCSVPVRAMRASG